MKTIREIKLNEPTKFEGFNDTELVESYGAVNVYKKEFTGLEASIKEAIANRKEAGVGFSNKEQLTLTFPTGDIEVSVNPRETVSYGLDIPEEELIELLRAEGINPNLYVTYKFSSAALQELKSDRSISLNVSAHIVKTSQMGLSYSSKNKGGK